jgi:rubredoxin
VPASGPEPHASSAVGARRECKICWQVYDPAEGDPLVWQIPPGTRFEDLPAHWTCPNCSATKDQFLLLNHD